MAILVQDDRQLESAHLDVVLRRARISMPGLGMSGHDVAVTLPGRATWQQQLPPGALLAVLTARPTALQASSALMIEARAYLSLDAHPSDIASALARVANGRLHIEAETASALLSLMELTEHSRTHPAVAGALRLAGRGWSWPAVVSHLDLDPAAVSILLLQIVGAVQRRLRVSS